MLSCRVAIPVSMAKGIRLSAVVESFQAKSAADRASAAVTDNPAKEFANRGKAAVRENLPVDGPAEWDLSSLQVDVSQKLQAQASKTAKQAASKVSCLQL